MKPKEKIIFEAFRAVSDKVPPEQYAKKFAEALMKEKKNGKNKNRI